jgi:ferredoxin
VGETKAKMDYIFAYVLFFALSLQLVQGFAPVRHVAHGWALNAEVELIWPNKKKITATSGTPLKAAAAKAGFKPNYGCDEGKCGSCELICNGKTKIRPCIGKVPGTATTLTNP